MRWEQDAVAEWLAYHYLKGVNRFFIYCNDDSPSEALAALTPSPVPSELVTFYHVDVVGLQRQCYYHFLDRHRAECDWAIFLDLDEFIVVRSADGIPGFLEDVSPDVGSVCLHWFQHGPNGVLNRGKRSVLQTYTRRSDHANFHCKNFFRPAALPRLTEDALTKWPFWHCWGTAFGEQLLSIDVLGRNMVDYYEHFPHRAAAALTPWANTEILRTAYISHFFMKSLNDAAYRVSRGASHDFENQNSWEQHSIDGSLPGIIAEAEVTEDRLLAGFYRESVGRHLKGARNAPGFGKISLTPLSAAQGLPCLDIVGEILMTGVLDGKSVVLKDVQRRSVVGAVGATTQILVVGSPPIWHYAFETPTLLAAIACFMDPQGTWSGQITLSINAGKTEVNYRSPLFGLYATLEPFIWQNLDSILVSEIAIVSPTSESLPIDQIKLFGYH